MASDLKALNLSPELQSNDTDMNVDAPPPAGLPQTAQSQENATGRAAAVPFPLAQRDGEHLPKAFADSAFYQAHTSQTSSRSEVPPDSYDDSAPTIDHGSIDHTSRQYASIAAHDTPKAKGATRDFSKEESIKIQGKSIMTTMGRAIYSSDTWGEVALGRKLGFTTGSLGRWLKSTDGMALYDYRTIEAEGSRPIKDTSKPKRWLTIPDDPDLESDLYTPYVNLISKIMKIHLKHGKERKVFDTHNKHLIHYEEHHTSPDIVVQGTGASFEMPSNGRPFGYSNMVTFIEIKLDSEMTREENIEQVLVYARQVFIHQPNRMFVRAIILSQNRAQVFHFDHGGIQRTPFYDIHLKPALFVGILLGVTTTANDRIHLGLDDTLQWTHDRKGRKVSGTLRTLALDRARCLELVETGPVSHHRHIRGSGTLWWKVHDPEAETYTEYLVKDSWSSAGRTSEWMLLARVNKKGIRGVAIMAWHEECIADVSTFRCPTTVDFFYNRTFSRIVMETYGREIQHFKSLAQLLRALRDALAAHGNLYGAGILHRDISNKTILLGRENAEVGDQGILIDLSVAFDYHSGGNSLITKEPIMSCAILDFLTELNDDEARGLAPAHDYLDDLESFFFVLCYLLFGFKPNGDPRPLADKARSVIKEWDNEEADLALARKNMLLGTARRQRELAAEVVGRSWGEACKTLFQEFLDWVMEIQVEKASLRREKYPEFLRQREEFIRQEQEDLAKLEAGDLPKGKAKDQVYLKSIYASLYLDAQGHYDRLLSIFKKAIMNVESSPPGADDAPRVSIPNVDPSTETDGGLPAPPNHTAGPIPFNLANVPKRRRYSSATGKDNFKVPELPPTKASRHDEDGNGAAWMIRSSEVSGDLDNPFV
ncbi:hypothetical protein FA13DRAFT_1713859 [Coprinellus micaceus]|uniref:Fungal-type protein kinase domain-containing protein n=1 Tax=Coprinellus micaceus TaxID=71717 RepID=A0A4Y7SUS5_COPMI|nr:hypothetical protein FA13DRAFT_1713859 [Coprinellus micaceus]